MNKFWFRHGIAFLMSKKKNNQAPSRALRWTEIIASALFILTIGISSSWAGPPFLTDDPEPVDYNHGEFYIAAQYAKDKDATSGTAPHFELNYGVAPNVMLHLITPFVYNKPEGQSTQRGYGDTEIGVKYRFINDEDAHVMVGTFPIVGIHSGDSDKVSNVTTSVTRF